MISLTGEYALRAMIFLTEHADECPIPGPRIAESSGVPRKYLSSILADLVRSGILEGTRGKSGGFQIARPTREIRLLDVVAPFEPVQSNRRACPFGNKICSEQDPCAAHEKWKEVNAALTRFLEETTLLDFALKRARSGNGSVKV